MEISDLHIIIWIRQEIFWGEFSHVVSGFQTLAQRFSEMPLPGVIFGHVEGMLLNIYNAQDSSSPQPHHYDKIVAASNVNSAKVEKFWHVFLFFNDWT